MESGADGFLKELRQAFSSGVNIFPLPYPSAPEWSGAASPRIRHRWKRKRQLWRELCRLVTFLNSMNNGSFRESHGAHYSDAGGRMSEAQTQVLRMLWDLAKHNLRDRREFALTGGHSAILSLIKKGEIQDGYVRVKAGPTQISLIADKVVEPSDDSVVHLLEALPPMEALYYAKETNVIERGGKSEQIQLEIEQQYGFVGGTKAEYIKYFRREDLPSNMWTWMPYSEVKAVAGFSVVPKNKKEGQFQRKLLMCCSTNYLWEPVEQRSAMGMDGAGAINRVHAEGLAVEVAACDQSNAFTKVLCPKWFYPYQAVPPVVAAEVWDLLPMAVQSRVAKHDLVSPVYMRLPMGSSHSVHILMSINLQIIGRTLHSFLQRGTTPGADMPAEERKEAGRIDCDEDETNAYDMSDEDWWSVFSKGANLGRKDAGYSVHEWMQHLIDLKKRDFRTITIMIFFAGERRQDDIQSQVERMAKERNISVSVISVDLATDDRWDLASKETFHVILQMMKGFVDIVLGGPPCATVSRARFNRQCQGPRPVRFRWCVWGRKDLTTCEEARVREANGLWLHYMAICESVSGQGGAHLWEHPEDPGAVLQGLGTKKPNELG